MIEKLIELWHRIVGATQADHLALENKLAIVTSSAASSADVTQLRIELKAELEAQSHSVATETAELKAQIVVLQSEISELFATIAQHAASTREGLRWLDMSKHGVVNVQGGKPELLQ